MHKAAFLGLFTKVKFTSNVFFRVKLMEVDELTFSRPYWKSVDSGP